MLRQKQDIKISASQVITGAKIFFYSKILDSKITLILFQTFNKKFF